jgi:hypothetical protein
MAIDDLAILAILAREDQTHHPPLAVTDEHRVTRFEEVGGERPDGR